MNVVKKQLEGGMVLSTKAFGKIVERLIQSSPTRSHNAEGFHIAAQAAKRRREATNVSCRHIDHTLSECYRKENS